MLFFGVLLLLLHCPDNALSYKTRNKERIHFLKDFLHHQGRSATVVSHLQLSKKDHLQLCRAFSKNHNQFKIASEKDKRSEHTDDVVHLVDLKSESSRELLDKAIKDKSIKSPSRWLLFKADDRGNYLDSAINDYQRDTEYRLSDLYVDMGTEVYVAFQRSNYVHLYAIYKIKANLPFIWEEYGKWSPESNQSRAGSNQSRSGFDRPPPPPVAMRRRDMRGADIVAATVILDNRTLQDMPDYLHREVDTLSKIMFYMTTHLVEWVNGTKVLNRTLSWGYRMPDGRYDGVVREIEEGRADMSGSVMIPTKERSEYLNFVIPPAPIEALFIFKKPALASVTNIYVLPFSIGVWISVVILVFTSSLTLYFAYFREDAINPQRKVSRVQKISDGFFDILCLVFQQGTAIDPFSIASEYSITEFNMA